MKLSYILVAVFMSSGQSYIEQDGLTLHRCAAEAALSRQAVQELFEKLGEIRFYCIPEIS